jgi:hypothetical protein
MKLLNNTKKIAKWLWQAPQNILGCMLYHYADGYETCTKELCGEGVRCKINPNFPGGITLGQYIVVNNFKQLQHELGHVMQSQKLGPLYLLVIGLPSIIHASLHDKFCKVKDYHHFYTEKWANKLAGL